MNTSETHQAQELLEGRYARLKSDPDARGWYPADWIDENLRDWADLLGPLHPQPGRAVELGCGAGNLSLDLAARGWKVDGFDVSANAVEWARTRASEAGLPAEFAAFDLGAPLPDAIRARLGGRVDLVVDSDCLHYILGERRPVFLANARALLAPEGTFVVHSIVDEPAPEDWEKLGYDPATRTGRIAGIPMTYHADREGLLRELAAAGFHVRESRVIERDDRYRPHTLLVAIATLADG